MITTSLGTAITIGIILLVIFIALRLILKITHVVFTVGCLAVIILAVLFVLLGGLPLPVR